MIVADLKSDPEVISPVFTTADSSSCPCVLLNYIEYLKSSLTLIPELLREIYSKFRQDQDLPVLIIDSIGEAPDASHLTFVDDLKITYPDLKIIHVTTGWDPEQTKYQTITEFSTFFWPIVNKWKDSFSNHATHHFVAAANYPRGHRTRFVNSLLNRNLQQYGYFSIGSSWSVENAKMYLLEHIEKIGFDEKNMEYFPSYIEGQIKIKYNGSTPDERIGKTYDIDDPKISGALVNVVLESAYEPLSDLAFDQYWKVPFLTEKTVKPFALGQIPLILGPWKMLEKIKGIGFDSFDDIIDTSYDNEKDPILRIEKFVDSLDQFINSHPQGSLQDIKNHLLTRLHNNRRLAEKISVCTSAKDELKSLLDKFNDQRKSPGNFPG